MLNLPHGFDLLSKCQNHEEDCANFCGLLRKAELEVCELDMYIFEPIFVYYLGLVKLENSVPTLLKTNKKILSLLALHFDRVNNGRICHILHTVSFD